MTEDESVADQHEAALSDADRVHADRVHADRVHADQADTDRFDVDQADAELAGLDFAPAISATGAFDDAATNHAAANDAQPHVRRLRRTGRTARSLDLGSNSDRSDSNRPNSKRPARQGLRRRLTNAVVLLVALAAMGGTYAAFASSSSAQASSTASASDVEAGKQMFQVACITCHGANLQGVQNRGVALIGVGGAAVYFQVSTGRMPVAEQGPEIMRKPAKYTDEQVRQIAAYVQSVGGGPAIPEGNLSEGDLGAGGQLFRLNCASCHGFAGKGAPLSAGKIAPSLNEATNLQIWTAMLSGPESMPVFNDNQITPTEKAEIVQYIQTLKVQKDPGGAGLDRIGPVSEGVVIWIIGIGVILIVIVFIGRKA